MYEQGNPLCSFFIRGDIMSVATTVYDQTCHVCETIKKYFLTFYYNAQRGKQLSVNRDIYDTHMKWDTEKDYHFNKMNETTNNEYNAKIKRLWNPPLPYDGL